MTTITIPPALLEQALEALYQARELTEVYGTPRAAFVNEQCHDAITALRAALAQEPQTTHSDECWRWHHACAVAMIERHQAEEFCDANCTWADHAPGCVRAEGQAEPSSDFDRGFQRGWRRAMRDRDRDFAMRAGVEEKLAALAQAQTAPFSPGDIAALVEQHLIASGYRKCAEGQRTTQFCGLLEEAVRREREK